jgi:hypothetical protein
MIGWGIFLAELRINVWNKDAVMDERRSIAGEATNQDTQFPFMQSVTQSPKRKLAWATSAEARRIANPTLGAKRLWRRLEKLFDSPHGPHLVFMSFYDTQPLAEQPPGAGYKDFINHENTQYRSIMDF